MEGFVAKWYSKAQEKSIEQYRSWAKMAIGHIPEGGRALEVAPGPGYLSVELAKLGDYRVVGLDISRTFVRIARERATAAGEQDDFRLGDAAYMPFPTGAFDFVICTSAFKNFPEPVKVLDEMFRVLRSGGEAVVIDLDKDAPTEDIDEYVNQMKLGLVSSFTTRLTFRRMLLKWAYTRNQMRDLVAESSFGVCDILDGGIGFEVWLKKP